GLLKIEGICWNLFDQVFCDKPLVIQGPRLRSTLEQRASRAGVYSNDLRLEVRVRSSVPRLRARFGGLSAAAPAVAPGDSASSPSASSSSAPLMQGELVSCSLVISNLGGSGSSAVRSLRVVSSHASFFAFESPEGLAEGVAVTHEGEALNFSCSSGSLVAEGSELRIPVLLWAHAAGRHALRILLLAEAASEVGTRIERCQWITLE
ncbi:unnamed protein product, partial [Polarella glacialis]